MERRIYFWGFPPFLLCAVAACGCGDGFAVNEEHPGMVTVQLLELNVRNPNALSPNALNPNALNPNALNPNALALNVLSEGDLPSCLRAALQEPGKHGALSRQLMSYVIGCALDRTQSFDVSWTDSAGRTHDETYAGLLGLATDWVHEPLSLEQQQWLSACLASRANWYGVSVTISSRGAHPALASTSARERAAFPMREGAFWGNLFAETPHLYACHDASNDANSRGQFRDCAAGHLSPPDDVVPCGPIQLVGACEYSCPARNRIRGVSSACRDDAGNWSSSVITTFLPSMSY